MDCIGLWRGIEYQTHTQASLTHLHCCTHTRDPGWGALVVHTTFTLSGRLTSLSTHALSTLRRPQCKIPSAGLGMNPVPRLILPPLPSLEGFNK